jgi:hypothetical protein
VPTGSSIHQGLGAVLVIVVNPLEDGLVQPLGGLSPTFGVGKPGGNLKQSQKPFSGPLVSGFQR